MGKFSRNREYTFVSLEELISSVIEEYNDGANVDIVLPWEEVNNILVALISTGKFKLYCVDFGLPEMDGYGYEYGISLSHLDDDSLFVEKIYYPDNDRYTTFCSEATDIMFVSAGVSRVCYDSIVADGCNTVLFDVED